MNQRRTSIALLTLAVALVAMVLAQRPWESRAIEQSMGPLRCSYDEGRGAVVGRVPLAVRTRGAMTWEVQARVYDRRDRARQPYIATETVTFDTGGELDRRTVQLSIEMREADWRAGFNDCTIAVRSVPSRD